jgi:hypothetical protein
MFCIVNLQERSRLKFTEMRIALQKGSFFRIICTLAENLNIIAPFVESEICVLCQLVHYVCSLMVPCFFQAISRELLINLGSCTVNANLGPIKNTKDVY